MTLLDQLVEEQDALLACIESLEKDKAGLLKNLNAQAETIKKLEEHMLNAWAMATSPPMYLVMDASRLHGVKLAPRTPTALTWVYQTKSQYNLVVNYNDGTSEKLRVEGVGREHDNVNTFRYEVR